jgi:hypothetical protein
MVVYQAPSDRPWRVLATRIRPFLRWSVSHHRTRAIARSWSSWLTGLGWISGVTFAGPADPAPTGQSPPSDSGGSPGRPRQVI